MLRRWTAGCFVSSLRPLRADLNCETSHRFTLQQRLLSTTKPFYAELTPLRKELKDVARASRSARHADTQPACVSEVERLSQWELTVGIEIHAQLNTSTKLFSCMSGSAGKR